ncbi:MAG: YihY/virulence factor BrkB family protein [Planctomycetaceae bacterium]|nr:YihY/virulence factor BrkB family protein [Planctomycetaceae bacterium]
MWEPTRTLSGLSARLGVVLRMLRHAGDRWSEDGCAIMSAAMSYYAACSLFPLCLVLTSVVGWMLAMSETAGEAQTRFLDIVSQQTSPWLAQQLTSILQSVKRDASGFSIWGTAGLLVASMGMFSQFDAVLEQIWHGHRRSDDSFWGYVKRAATSRLSAFLVLLVLGLLMGLLMVLELVLAGIREAIVREEASLWLWSNGQRLLTLGINALLLSLLFKTLPRARVKWRAAAAAGLFTAVIWKLGQGLLAAFVIGDYYSPYGVIGAFLAVMLWLYYLSAVLFLGAEVAWVAHHWPRLKRRQAIVMRHDSD